MHKVQQLPPDYSKTLIEPRLEYNGKIYEGTDKLGKLCRELGTGKVEVYNGDKLCYTCEAEERGKMSLQENSLRLTYRPYKPFPVERLTANRANSDDR